MVEPEKNVLKIKRNLAVELELGRLPTNRELALAYPQLNSQYDLSKKPVRAGSGISVITVMTKPFACPHGTCIFCPGGIRLGTPQSYTEDEPATRLAVINQYDANKQVASRLAHLRNMGHDISKVEVIVVGGTFLSYPLSYKYNFIKSIFDGLNGSTSPSLEESIVRNESAASRCVGLTVETKPEFCYEREVDEMLRWGVTRVEIGVQVLNDEIYKIVNRGHTVEDVANSFRIARDSGLKINAHMMPGLPGSSESADLESFKTLFEDERFKPDMLKIYPTLVVKGTELAKWYENGRYEPYEIEDLVELMCDIKRIVPKWVRIMRVQREIGSNNILAGPRSSNFRQMVMQRMKERGEKCKCIRCREIYRNKSNNNEFFESESPKLERIDYRASGGTEVFLSYVFPEDILIGFLRLRIPSVNSHRQEVITRPTALIRELHVYGRVVPIGARSRNDWQHKGFGSSLLSRAEEIAHGEFTCKRILVTSAVGTRNYYRKFGYEVLGPYMAKELS